MTGQIECVDRGDGFAVYAGDKIVIRETRFFAGEPGATSETVTPDRLCGMLFQVADLVRCGEKTSPDRAVSAA